MSDVVEGRVRLYDRDVGILYYEKGGASFFYKDDLTAQDHKTLGQIFEDDPRKPRRVRVGLPPWFANLLPEGELRKQIIREMGGGYVRDFTLLLRLGADLPGAVTVHSSTEPDDDIIDDHATEPDLADHPVRHSLAGVQLKYSIHGDRLTFPASGERAWWIAKLPDRSLKELPLNEYLTMRWLQEAGFNVPRVQLVPAASIEGIPEGLVDPGELIYLSERFDRRLGGRIHAEDFAQIADVAPTFKYGPPDAKVSYDSMGDVIFDLAGEVMAPLIYGDNFRRFAEHNSFDPDTALDTVRNSISRLRSAWSGELRTEAEDRFPALARHYSGRLESLPICDV